MENEGAFIFRKSCCFVCRGAYFFWGGGLDRTLGPTSIIASASAGDVDGSREILALKISISGTLKRPYPAI